MFQSLFLWNALVETDPRYIGTKLVMFQSLFLWNALVERVPLLYPWIHCRVSILVFMECARRALFLC